MTEMAQGLSQSSDTPSTPISSPVDSVQAPKQAEERTFRQSEVTDIVRRERSEAVDKYRRLQSEQPDYLAQKYGDADKNQPQPAKSAQHDESYYRKIAAEEVTRARDAWMQEANKKQMEELAGRTVQNFHAKVSQGREKYSDFDQVTGQVEFAAFPNVVQLLADHIENGSDVMYELGKDLSKMEVLESMATRSPKAALLQAQRLAQSLKANEDAKNVKMPREPLSQLRPSNNGTGTGGERSISDLRLKYKG